MNGGMNEFNGCVNEFMDVWMDLIDVWMNIAVGLSSHQNSQRYYKHMIVHFLMFVRFKGSSDSFFLNLSCLVCIHLKKV